MGHKVSMTGYSKSLANDAEDVSMLKASEDDHSTAAAPTNKLRRRLPCAATV
ncbi:MAG: hypothetical protein ACR2H7_03570 [Actinomycetota bacterium]